MSDEAIQALQEPLTKAVRASLPLPAPERLAYIGRALLVLERRELPAGVANASSSAPGERHVVKVEVRLRVAFGTVFPRSRSNVAKR